MASRVFTVPNQLTFLRLGFLPFFIISIHYRRYDMALAILIIAGLTDGLDGLLARSLNQKTALGAYLDPIADKLLLSSSFVMLALNRKISWWLATLVLSRDIILLTSAAVILVVSGYRPFPPSIYGKAHHGAANPAGVCRGAAGGHGLAMAASSCEISSVIWSPALRSSRGFTIVSRSPAA